MKYIKIMSIFLVFFLLFGGLIMAQKEEKEEARKKYEKAKMLVYEKKWDKAIEYLKHILNRLEESDYLDDSLYWLGYSLNKLSATLDSMDSQLETHQEALEYLNELIEEFRKSSWVDDAKILRIEIAKNLVKKGLSDQEEAVVEMINIAKKDSDQKVRKNALFWLSQKASEKAAQALKEAVESEEDIEVKDSAVFAISQLPEEKSVPMLIDIARNNKSPSVQKKAIFWLGQVGGEEALKFLEDILLKKK